MDAVVAKVLTIIILTVLTLVLGIIPYFIIKRGGDAHRSSLRERVLSVLNCFAGGVFLGTCLLHLLVEGGEDLRDAMEQTNSTDFPAFETLMGGGFFMIAFLEQVALMCMVGVVVTPQTTKQKTVTYEQNGSQGEKTPLMKTNNSTIVPYGVSAKTDNNYAGDYDEVGDQGRSLSNATELERSISHTHEFGNISSAHGFRAFLLLIALSFHTIFDGLAVGLQVDEADVWEVFAAISIHKSLVAFCLGLQLFRAFQPKFKKPLACLLLFTTMSPIGICIGIAVTSSNINSEAQDLTSGILQGLACGTFLYVTCFEILKDELTHKSHPLKVIICLVGFGAMAAVKALDRD